MKAIPNWLIGKMAACQQTNEPMPPAPPQAPPPSDTLLLISAPTGEITYIVG